jgi:hypothetical protein
VICLCYSKVNNQEPGILYSTTHSRKSLRVGIYGFMLVFPSTKHGYDCVFVIVDHFPKIIDAKPSATITTIKIKLDELKDIEEGKYLFHSQMWVKGTPVHFILDNESQKNLISTEVIKILKLLTMPHPQPYTISWLSQGQYLHINQ